MHDYRQFNYKINTNIVVINVNNVKYLTIILNNVDDFKVTTKHIHNIKLIKYFYKNFENSLIINQLNNETNFLINSNISLIEYLGKISSHLPGFIYQFKMTPDGTFSIPFASEKIYDVFGVSQKQVYDNPNLVFEIIHPEDAVRCKFAIMESANNLTTWKLQYRIIKNGNEIWIDGESRPELKSDGSILWHGYASSISDIMMLQQKMEESEAYKRSLLGAINKSIIVSIAGLDGKIKEVNDAEVYLYRNY